MRMFTSFFGMVFMLLVVLALVWMAFVTLPGQQCEQAASQMGLNYSFSPVSGCFVQQPSGSWTQINQPVIVNQP